MRDRSRAPKSVTAASSPMVFVWVFAITGFFAIAGLHGQVPGSGEVDGACVCNPEDADTGIV